MKMKMKMKMNEDEEDHHDGDDEEDHHDCDDEETLSFRDFPVSNNDKLDPPPKSSFTTNSTCTFQFFTDFTDPISHAEDIFYSGKLIPLNQTTFRSESLNSNRSATTEARLMRNTRSFDDRKLNRVWSMKREVVPEVEVRRNSVQPRRRWYIMGFGLVKLTGEMESRRSKRRSISMFRRSDDEEKCAVASKLVRVLSCRGRSSVAVTLQAQL